MIKRREFLQTSVGAASGAMLVMVHAGARADENPAGLQVALIGAGSQGRVLLNAAVGLPGVRFRAVCDIWDYARNYGQKFLGRYGQQVETYADYRRMLENEKQLDAVLIATPDFAHAQQVRDCLESGVHVYCEPMLAHTVLAARELVKAMRRTGKLLQVGYQRRSNPRYRHVVEKLLGQAHLPARIAAIQTQWAQEASGSRGWPRRYTIAEQELRRHGYRNMEEFRNWLWYPQYCGGPFCSFVSQQLDVCNWFLGAPPGAVLASGGGEFYEGRPHLDTVMSVYEYPGEDGPIRASCNLLTTSSAGGMRQYERFLGRDGSIQISENARWTRICRESNADDWEDWVRKQYLIKPKVTAAHEAEDDAVEVHVSGEVELFTLPVWLRAPNCQPHLDNFFAAVRGEAELRCPADVALLAHVAAFKALDAVKARKTLSFDRAEFTV